MASSSPCSSSTLLLHHNHKSRSFQFLPALTIKNGVEFPFFGGSNNLQLLQTSPHLRAAIRGRRSSNGSQKDFVVTNAIPGVAGDLLASFRSLPAIPGLPDDLWSSLGIIAMAGLLAGVPILIQRLLTLTKEVDIAAQTVEKVAVTVGKVAEEVEKAAVDIEKSLPEGGLQRVVSFVEDLAEETAKDAKTVEDLMDKVEEMDRKLEEFLERQTQGVEKA